MSFPRVIWSGGGAGPVPWCRIVQLREPDVGGNWFQLENRSDCPDALGVYGWSKVELHSGNAPPVEALALSVVEPAGDLALAMEYLRCDEWCFDASGARCCRSCDSCQRQGHAPDCKFAALLAKYQEPAP